MEDIVEMLRTETEHYETAYVKGIIKGRIISLGKGAKNIDEKYIMTTKEKDSLCHAFVSGQKIGETVMAEKIVREIFKEHLNVNIDKLSEITGLTKGKILSLNY